MVTMAAVLGVGLIELGMALTPGPNMMYLVSRSIGQGRAAGLVSLMGVLTGFCLYVLATAAGLSVLFLAVPGLFVVVKIVGALYLLYLAWGMVRDRRRLFGAVELEPHSSRRLFSMGLTTCLLNPKIALLYAALLPQFVDPDRGSVTVQIIILGLVQVAVGGTVNGMWVILASGVRRLLEARRRAERIVRWATGALLAAFAVDLGLSSPATAASR